MNELNFLIKNISLVGGKSTFTLATPLSYNKLNYELSLSGAFRYFLSSQSVKDMELKGAVNDLGFEFSGQALDMVNDFSPTIDGKANLEALKFSGVLPISLASMPSGLS